ncbi:retinol-binding protein pinta-like isoform X2 [Photinus pyralis]|uniref:retinol-binding protein pinta-like isoform X2 n=1 Tax=Photinus pyralis TaxID=7054 RepID=UPI001266FB3B|nr:retinol-binding protein pinta-like isoform X2 [Photinus pyralis]XP_031345047.1 retinol-binding protein pinta-like isoform X2 [Photinus pyralis]
MRQLSSALQIVAEAELNEVRSRLETDFQQIRDWFKKQPHLSFEIDDQLLISFLRCSKFSLERTKEKLDYYFTMRSLAPEVFTNRDPLLPEIQAILNAGFMLPLPKAHGEDGSRIVLCRYSDNLDPNTMNFTNLFKVNYMLLDILLREDDNAIVSGIIAWVYYKKMPPKYAVQMTPTDLHKYSMITIKGYPLRHRGTYHTHLPTLFQVLYDSITVIFPKKTQERSAIFGESNFAKFYDKIPQELLPEEFGGSNSSVKDLTVFWKQKVESYRDWFLSDEKLKTNEALRPGAPRNGSDIFGVEVLY